MKEINKKKTKELMLFYIYLTRKELTSELREFHLISYLIDRHNFIKLLEQLN